MVRTERHLTTATARKGFTLVELLIALTLALVVMIAIFSMLGSLVKIQVEEARDTAVTAYGISAIEALRNDLGDSNYLVWPTSTSITDDKLMVCRNWSGLLNSLVDPYAGNPGVDVYYYCYDGVTTGNGGNLLRMHQAGLASCPPLTALPAACTTANYGGNSVIATRVYYLGQNSANKVFTRDATEGGIVVQMTIGSPVVGNNGGVVGANVVNVQSFDVRTHISMAKSFLNSFD